MPWMAARSSERGNQPVGVGLEQHARVDRGRSGLYVTSAVLLAGRVQRPQHLLREGCRRTGQDERAVNGDAAVARRWHVDVGKPDAAERDAEMIATDDWAAFVDVELDGLLSRWRSAVGQPALEMM